MSLAGCGSGDDDNVGNGSGTPTPTPTGTPTPSSTVPIPSGVEITEPGTQLEFKEPGTVVYEPRNKDGSVLQLTVLSAAQGTLKDFAGFLLDTPYKRKGNYFYVRTRTKNLGPGNLGGQAVPLWGMGADNTLLPAVEMPSAFQKCPTQPFPKKFGKGATHTTCLIFLSPDHGPLEGVAHPSNDDVIVVEWHGKVTPPPGGKKR
jgi:hypothetical protein